MINIFNKGHFLYSTAFVLSLILVLLSVWQYPVFNPDGILYLSVAKIYQTGSLSEAIALFKWPFYPCLIAIISTISKLSLLHSAYLLNFLFFVGTVFCFIKLVNLVGGNIKLQWLGLFLILFFRPLNKFNHQIIRDHGYWCFILLGAVFLLMFIKNFRWYYAVFWALATGVATLFRIEGVCILLVLPFSIFFLSSVTWHEKLTAFLKLYMLAFLGALIAFIFLITHRDVFYHLIHLEPITGYFTAIFHLINIFHRMDHAMATYVLPVVSRDSASALLLAGGLTLYFYKAIFGLTVSCLIMVGYALFKRVKWTSGTAKIIWAYVFINVLITLGHGLLELYFFERYDQLIYLFLLIYAPFGLLLLWQDVKQKPISFLKRFLFIIVAVFWMIMVVGSLVRIGPSKLYVYDSARWVEKHIPSGVTVHTNIGQLLFLTNRNINYWKCSSKSQPVMNCFDWSKIKEKSYYFVVNMRQDDAELKQLIQKMDTAPLVIFKGQHPKKEVVVFKKN